MVRDGHLLRVAGRRFRATLYAGRHHGGWICVVPSGLMRLPLALPQRRVALATLW